jgi:hypothetical protein
VFFGKDPSSGLIKNAKSPIRWSEQNQHIFTFATRTAVIANRFTENTLVVADLSSHNADLGLVAAHPEFQLSGCH